MVMMISMRNQMRTRTPQYLLLHDNLIASFPSLFCSVDSSDFLSSLIKSFTSDTWGLSLTIADYLPISHTVSRHAEKDKHAKEKKPAAKEKSEPAKGKSKSAEELYDMLVADITMTF